MLLNVTSVHKYGEITNQESDITEIGGQTHNKTFKRKNNLGGKSKCEIANYSLNVIYIVLGGKLTPRPQQTGKNISLHCSHFQ